MINNILDLDTFCADLRRDLTLAPKDEVFLAVDTEFVRSSSNEPILCLIQISSHARSNTIDMLNIGFSQSIADLMSDHNILKVFHGSDQDLDVLIRNQIFIHNMHDTQLAELAISTDKIASYESLVLKYLKRSIKKTYKTSDWTKRPLSKDQEKYALNDVIYLREIYKNQIKIIKEKNRQHIVDNEMNDRLMAYGSAENINVLDAFNKHIYELNDESIGVLKELATWRLQRSKELNKPGHLIIKNDILLSVAKNGLNRLKQIKKSRFSKDDEMAKFVKFATNVCKNRKFSCNVPEKDTSIVIDFLKILLDYCSQKYSINKHFIAINDDITAIAYGVESVLERFKTGWRYDVFGQYIPDALNGNISIKLLDGKLEISNG